jgi:di/tricarboxylate transporter
VQRLGQRIVHRDLKEAIPFSTKQIIRLLIILLTAVAETFDCDDEPKPGA